MQIEYVVLGGLAALAGFITSLVLTFRKIYLATRILNNRLVLAEEAANKEISEISFDELKLTPAGRDLLELIGTEEALAKLNESNKDSESTANSVFMTLAEEASSEVVQKELEAMSLAIRESMEDMEARASAFIASIAQVKEDYAHVEVSRDTSAEELKAVLEKVEDLKKQLAG